GAEAVARVRDLVGDPNLPLVSIVRAPTPAAMAREIFGGVGTGGSGVVPLQASGSRMPLFLVHPGDGEVLAFARLAQSLGADQPSYALRARGIDDGKAGQPSLAEMAADYLAEIRHVQPRGPYALGGFCFGGPVALEMAALLEAEGEKVATVVLLDPRFRRPATIRYKLGLARRRTRQGLFARSVARRAKRLAGRTPPAADEPLEPGDIQQALAALREAYVPRPSNVPTTVILSEEFKLADDFELPAWYVRSIVKQPRRWRQFPVPHTRLLLPPTVELVASEIRAALEEGAAP